MFLSNFRLWLKTWSWLCFPLVTTRTTRITKITLYKINRKDMYYRSGIWHIGLKNFLRFKNWLSPLSPSLSTLTTTLNPIPQERSQKFFRPNFFLIWNFFRLKIYSGSNFLGTKVFFWPRIFSNLKFIQTQISLKPQTFLPPRIFWT